MPVTVNPLRLGGFVVLLVLVFLLSYELGRTAHASPRPVHQYAGDNQMWPDTVRHFEAGLTDSAAPTSTPTPKDPKKTHPLSTSKYCWNEVGTLVGPTAAPTQFMYQPYEGSLSPDDWSSQMDHDTPDYRLNGVIASLGAIRRYDDYEPPEHLGGTEVYPGYQHFPYTTAPSDIAKKGYSVLAYWDPLYEMYIYYDGHDGHDYVVSGNAVAAADGEVVFKGDYQNSFGRIVEVYHPQGYLTRYAHLASFADKLEVGNSVTAGQALGTIGGSGYAGGVLNEHRWGVHLHFSVFRWNQERKEWQVTDPYGWDYGLGPDVQNTFDVQKKDPLVKCNGEVSYNLWVDWSPRPYKQQTAAAEPARPSHDRYIGGWVEEGAVPTGADVRLLTFPNVPVLQPGQTAPITVTVQNTGPLAWAPGDMITLRNVSGETLGLAPVQRLPQAIPAGGLVTWPFVVQAPAKPGVYDGVWQMAANGAPFGERIHIALVVVPKGSETGLGAMIQAMIDKARQDVASQIDAAWEDLKQRIEERIKEEVQRQVQRQIRSICGAAPTGLVIAGGIVWWRRRQRKELP